MNKQLEEKLIKMSKFQLTGMKLFYAFIGISLFLIYIIYNISKENADFIKNMEYKKFNVVEVKDIRVSKDKNIIDFDLIVDYLDDNEITVRNIKTTDLNLSKFIKKNELYNLVYNDMKIIIYYNKKNIKQFSHMNPKRNSKMMWLISFPILLLIIDTCSIFRRKF